MAKACYDPHESIRFFARLAELERRNGGGGRGLKYFSTHPQSDDRAKELKRDLGNVMGYYNAHCGARQDAFEQMARRA